MSTFLRIAIASFLATGASLAHAHSGFGDFRPDTQVVKKEVAGEQLAQNFRGAVFRSGRGLPPSPCRSRCSR